MDLITHPLATAHAVRMNVSFRSADAHEAFGPVEPKRPPARGPQIQRPLEQGVVEDVFSIPGGTPVGHHSA